MKLSGIYKIQSTIKPDRIYIGSAIDVSKRWGEHLSTLRNNKHSSKKLQRHFNKYGEIDLIFSTLLGCERVDLIKTEQYFIDSYNPYFNSRPNAGNQLGFRHSPETIIKLKKIKKGFGFGRKLSEETKRKMSESLRGNRHSLGIKKSEEEKRGMSNRMMGRRLSEESKLKISKANKGRVAWNRGISPPFESRIKMSKSQTGKKRSIESIAKQLVTRKGLKYSEDSKKRMSEAQKMAWIIRRAKKAEQLLMQISNN